MSQMRIIERLIYLFSDTHGEGEVAYQVNTGDERNFFRSFVSQIIAQARQSKGVETTLSKIEIELSKQGEDWSHTFFASSHGKRLLKRYVGHNKKIEKIIENAHRMKQIGIRHWVQELQLAS